MLALDKQPPLADKVTPFLSCLCSTADVQRQAESLQCHTAALQRVVLVLGEQAHDCRAAWSRTGLLAAGTGAACGNVDRLQQPRSCHCLPASLIYRPSEI